MSSIWQPSSFLAKGRFFRLFLSHTSAHKHDVGLLSSALWRHGVAGFVAHDAIQPSLEWQDVIIEALRECEALAAYLTNDFPASLWTDQEIGAAVVRGLLVLPLRIDVNPYGFFSRYQALNAAGMDPHVLAAQIAAALSRNPLTRDAMAEAVVDRFAHSYSFDNARENLNRLQGLPRTVWTQDLKTSVERAAVENDQINGAVIGFGTNQRNVGDEAISLIRSLR